MFLSALGIIGADGGASPTDGPTLGVHVSRLVEDLQARTLGFDSGGVAGWRPLTQRVSGTPEMFCFSGTSPESLWEQRKKRVL